MHLEHLPIGGLVEHPANPRKHFDPAALAELTSSVREHGVLVPLLVRKLGIQWQIIGGARRFRAARAAGLETLPAIVRELDDAAASELLILDNLQRRDLTVLEEADGYLTLMKVHGYSVERIAEKIGMSSKYVYDRAKLVQLVAPARKLLEAGEMTPGHAILLARLKPEEQKLAIAREGGGLFQAEHTLFDPLNPEVEGDAGYKTRTVNELAAWIDTNVRFKPDLRQIDPVVFPDTVQALQDAKVSEARTVQITYDYMLPPATRDASVRTYTSRSWKRADGKHGSKPCEYAVLGLVVAGAHRGEAFHVCVAKDKCSSHWKAERAEAARRKKARAAGEGEQDKEAQRRKREDARRVMETKIKDVAHDILEVKLAAAARELEPGDFLRCAARIQLGTGGDVKGRSLPDLQVAYAKSLNEEAWDDPRVASAFAVDWAAILATAKAKVKEEAAQTSASAEGPTKATKKGRKTKGDS